MSQPSKSRSSDDAGSHHVEEVFLRDDSSGRIHVAIRVDDGPPRVNDACNVSGERVYLTEMPETFDDNDLCRQRSCFGDRG